MDRRVFIVGAASGLLTWPLAAAAQPPGKVPVVGVLYPGIGPETSTTPSGPILNNARQGLRDLGYVDGKNIAFEVRFAGGKPETLPGLAADLVRRKVDVLLTIGPAALRAARDATSAIPIVAIDLESDPVQAGFARSLAQPGANITGLFLDQAGLAGKWLELIREAAPGTRRIAVLVDTATGPWQLAAIKRAAEKLRIELQVLEVRTSGDLNQALGAAVKGGSLALVTLSSPLFDSRLVSKQIAEFTMEHRLPAISFFRFFAVDGGLMAYGPDRSEYTNRSHIYIDKILKGANPADLPIEQPTKFYYVINLKTAKALGLTIPQTLLLRADEVIQ
jgi:putative tryptophan/tyrosine transport system substrate-binding protein